MPTPNASDPLVHAADDANRAGQHSAAMALCRSMEDALDLFEVVGTRDDATQRWVQGNLKASDAAKMLGSDIRDLPSSLTTDSYRKDLRNYFNPFAHCGPQLVEWNVDQLVEGVSADGQDTIEVQFRVNHEQRILKKNGVRIGAYLLAHVWEFSKAVQTVYGNYLKEHTDVAAVLENGQSVAPSQL